MKIGKNRIKYFIIFCILTISITLITPIVFAKEMLEVTASKDRIEKGQEVEIIVSTENKSIASLTLQIYFDMEKLEYLNKIENSNFVQNRVIYTWVNHSGGSTEKQSNIIEKFTFKALKDGNANIVVTGEFYDKNGDKIEIEDGNIQIQIENENNTEDTNQENVSLNNTNLKALRINKEGISPEFQKAIKDYYFIADDSINKLEVTAVPENKEAQITITGNTNLKQGLNTIKIEVQSADKTKKSIYQIHVTKTSNPDLANSNLENLAVREAMLYPPFDANITQYHIEIAQDIDKANILAIPERMGAKVTIKGNEKLKIGNNNIIIDVTAEDGITQKKYLIKAYRRNEQEEVKAKEEEQNTAEQLSSILANEQEENQKKKENKQERQEENKMQIKTEDAITWCLLVVIVIGFGIGFIVNKNFFL